MLFHVKMTVMLYEYFSSTLLFSSVHRLRSVLPSHLEVEMPLM